MHICVCVYIYLIHVVWQKPAQNCKASKKKNFFFNALPRKSLGSSGLLSISCPFSLPDSILSQAINTVLSITIKY